MIGLAAARRVADAVLYEGYALYPYRASAAKNRIRFQWGVVVPAVYAGRDPSERCRIQSETIVERGTGSHLRVRVRFLHLTQRTLQAKVDGWETVETLDLGDSELQTWDEVEIDVDVDLDTARSDSPHRQEFELEGDESVEEVVTADGSAGRVLRHRLPIRLRVAIEFDPVISPYGIGRLRTVVENTTVPDSPLVDRDNALRLSLVGCHLLSGLDGARFVSQMDPPEWARGWVSECQNEGVYPVLVGEEDGHMTMLASPIILSDHPEIAPESPGDLFDATEIDEILTLRTMTLTDEEKRQARGTDNRTASIIDHVDHLPPEMLERLHGAIRQVGSVGFAAAPGPTNDDFLVPDAPWWDPSADQSVSPETDSVMVGGVAVSRGSRVRLSPRLQRADAQDMFFTGRIGCVEAVLSDVDGEHHIAVSLEDDPGADLVQIHGRFLYFGIDEVTPLGDRK